MTNPLARSVPSPRRLTCARCGAEFGCTLSTDCWCGEEAARLPLPTSGTGFADCLCRDCLRAVAVLASLQHHTINAVLLDMDGTLLDTERVYRTSLCNALADLGYGDGTGAPGEVRDVGVRDGRIVAPDEGLTPGDPRNKTHNAPTAAIKSNVSNLSLPRLLAATGPSATGVAVWKVIPSTCSGGGGAVINETKTRIIEQITKSTIAKCRKLIDA